MNALRAYAARYGVRSSVLRALACVAWVVAIALLAADSFDAWARAALVAVVLSMAADIAGGYHELSVLNARADAVLAKLRRKDGAE